jgi:hypothetical protein
MDRNAKTKRNLQAKASIVRDMEFKIYKLKNHKKNNRKVC